MAESVDVGTLDLPSKLFKNKFGFGIDFGSSIIKVVYTTDEGEHLRIHITNFPRQAPKEALEFLKIITDGKLEPGGTYYTAGVGVGEYLDEVQATLNIKCNIVSEHQRMINAFKFLAKHQSWEDFVYPPCQDAIKKGAANSKTMVDISYTMCPADEWKIWKYLEKENEAIHNTNAVQYPLLLALVGSGHYLFKIENEEKHKALDFYTVAGRTILGLGALLLGADSYSDVMELAEKGDGNNIDQYLNSIGASDADEVYSSLNACDAKLFSFGNAAKDKNKDNHKKEDIAAALRSMITNTVAQDAFNWSMMENVHQVYFLGGVVANNEVIRREIEQEFMFKSYGNPNGHVCGCFFVKAGGHLPAIGALLANLETA